MFWIGKLAFIYGVVGISILGLVTRSVFAAFVKPPVDLSPTCGPAELGFNIVKYTNGFAPNRTAAWKFVGSDNKIPLCGCIKINSACGFNDVIFADDLKPDDYKMHLANDVNCDGTFDIGAARIYEKVTVPCKE
jgi:hypothetical protein